jgi:hypothetical protein
VLAVCYEFPLPPGQAETTRQAVARWYQDGQDSPESAPQGVEMQVHQDLLSMRLLRNVPHPAKPLEILTWLGLAAPDQPLTGLIRSDVQLVS